MPLSRFQLFSQVRAGVATAIGAAGGATVLWLFPRLELECFAHGAARLAGVLLGTNVTRVEPGWLLHTADLPVVVTTACSATDFFVIVAALLAWQLARKGAVLAFAIPAALAAAVPLTIASNALRVVALTQAHRWIIPQFPENFGASLHVLTGVAIFLPALIGLNLLLEFHGRTHSSAAPRR